MPGAGLNGTGTFPSHIEAAGLTPMPNGSNGMHSGRMRRLAHVQDNTLVAGYLRSSLCARPCGFRSSVLEPSTSTALPLPPPPHVVVLCDLEERGTSWNRVAPIEGRKKPIGQPKAVGQKR